MDAVFTPNLDKLRNIVQSFGASSFRPSKSCSPTTPPCWAFSPCRATMWSGAQT